MKHRAFVIFIEPDQWRVAVPGEAAEGTATAVSIEASSDDSPANLAARSAASLHAGGYRGGRDVVVALGADYCLAATVATDGIPRRGRRAALLYRLEEKLPMAAEELAADFVVRNGHALGVAAPVHSLAAILEALADENIDVLTVSPQALLALHGAQILHPAIRSADAVLWQDGSQLELFAMTDGRPTGWVTVPAEPADLRLAIASAVLSRRCSLKLAAIDAEPVILDELADSADVESVEKLSIGIDHAVVLASSHIMRGAAPLVDIRGGLEGGGFARRELRLPALAAGVAILALSLCFLAAIALRASQYASIQTVSEARKQEVFRKVFPGEPIPVGIESRLRSARRELSAPEKQPGDSAVAVDAFHGLRELLVHLPPDVRFRISDLDLDGTHLSLQGEVATVGDAEAIVSALRRSSALSVDEPQVQQLVSGSVQFSIAGTTGAASPANRSRP